MMQEQLRAIELLLEKQDVKKAEVVIARNLRPGVPDTVRAELLTCRARARLLSAKPDDAIADLLQVKSLIDDEFDTPQLLGLLADCYFARYELSSVGFADRNDAIQAFELYQRVVEEFVDYDNAGWVHYQLGRVLLAINQIEQAVHHFQKALLAPSYEVKLTAYCYERLGFVALYEQRDLDKAITFLNKAIDTYPAAKDRLWLVQVHILKSRVLREMYKYDQALQAAENALAIATTTARSENKMGLAEALLTAGELLSKLEGRERDVVTYLQQFLQVSKRPLGVDVTWSRVHEMLGDSLFRMGQYDEAAAAYLAALQYNPYHPWETSIYYRIARSYYQKQNYEKAVEAIQRMLTAAEAEGQDVHDYRIYDVLGNAQFALGNYAKAAEAYQAALDVAPPNAENLHKIQTYYRFALELDQPL